MSDQSEDNQFSVGDILWEYADFDPIEPEPVPQPAPVMPSPQPVSPQQDPETPKPSVINPDLPANAAPGEETAQRTKKPEEPKLESQPKPDPPKGPVGIENSPDDGPELLGFTPDPKPAPQPQKQTSAGTKPQPKPGTKPPAKPGTAPANKPGTTQAAKPGTAPAAKPGTAPAAKPGAAPATKPGTTPAAKPGTAPATKPGTAPTTKPGTAPAAKPGTAPAAKPGTAPAANPAPSTNPEPDTKPETKPETEPKPDTAPATQPETEPVSPAEGTPEPAPTPGPAPAPAPGPTPTPGPMPTPGPTPTPGPKPGPKPGPATGTKPGAAEEETFTLKKERKPRPQPGPPPDATPTHLASEFALGLGEKKARAIGSVVTSVVLVVLALLDYDLIPIVGGMFPTNLLTLASLGLFLLCAFLCREVIQEGLTDLTNKHPTERTLVLFASLFTLLDGVTLLASNLRTESLPFFAPCGLVLTCHFCGMYLTQAANLQACRVAASVDQPYLVTQDPNVLGGKPSYRKWLSHPRGFGSQIRTTPDGLLRFRRLAPVLLVACFCLSLITTVAHRQPWLVLWSLSALFTASSTLSAPLAYSLGFRLVGRKLAQVGAALAGWPGILAGKGCRSVLLQDYDVYPPGTVTLTSAQVFSNLAMERVVSYTASLVRASGSGLTFLFDKILQAEKGGYLSVEKVTLQDNGLLGLCQGQQVMVGNSDFMSRMGVALPSGIKSKDAIFCAVGGTAMGVFGLRYTLHPTILPALRALFAHHIGPVMVTRDFNLSPQRLRLRGRLPVDQLTFPDLQRRVILSTPGQNHGGTITAVLCREGLAPYSQAVIGAKRLRWTTQVSSLLSIVSACLGVFLTATLSSAAAIGAMCAWNLSVYLLLWLVPTAVLSIWSAKY